MGKGCSIPQQRGRGVKVRRLNNRMGARTNNNTVIFEFVNTSVTTIVADSGFQDCVYLRAIVGYLGSLSESHCGISGKPILD